MPGGMTGKGIDRMPDWAFRGMSLIFKIRDMFVSMDGLLDEFGIDSGQTIVDFGCGPGSYIKKASELVGPEGKVFAVDIHELAIKAVNKRIKKENLDNVAGLVAVDGKCPLDNDVADLLYALDMFHMVGNPDAFLKELNRITKPNGFLFIDNGHQPREEAKSKINTSTAWTIVEENKRYMKCSPI
ncbi:MAG: class I SAM-dependent methyltransferase [Proteobacteria bacterium]|nr:class I SAM-dependent methyltransferase [Pseudomonadota bacterium]